jgi:hypothetical protein
MADMVRAMYHEALPQSSLGLRTTVMRWFGSLVSNSVCSLFWSIMGLCEFPILGGEGGGEKGDKQKCKREVLL